MNEINRSLGGEGKMRRLFKRGGQSTLEYLIVLVGLVAAIILAKNYVQGRVETALNAAGDKIVEETESLMATNISAAGIHEHR